MIYLSNYFDIPLSLLIFLYLFWLFIETLLIYVFSYSGAAKILRSDADILRTILSNLECLPLLPLLARVLHLNSLISVVITASTVKRLISVASNATDLMYVAQILYYLTGSKDESAENYAPSCTYVAGELKPLVEKIKPHWKDEELMHRLLRLIKRIQINTLDEDYVFDIIRHSGVLSTVSILLSLLFSQDKHTMDIKRVYNYQKSRTHPSGSIIVLWLNVIIDYRYIITQHIMVDEIRPIIPIVDDCVQQLKNNPELTETCPAILPMNAFIQFCNNLKSKKDFELLANSTTLLHLIKLYELKVSDENYFSDAEDYKSDDGVTYYDSEKLGIPDDDDNNTAKHGTFTSCSGKKNNKKEIEPYTVNDRIDSSGESHIITAVHAFLCKVQTFKDENLTTTNIIALLPTLAAISKSDMLFKNDVENAILPFYFSHGTWLILCEFVATVSEEYSKELYDVLYLHKIIPALVYVAKSNLDRLSFVVDIILHILVSSKTQYNNLYDHIPELLLLILDCITDRKKLKTCKYMSINASRNKEEYNPDRSKLPLFTVYIVKCIAEFASIDQIKNIDSRFKVFEKLFIALDYAEHPLFVYEITQPFYHIYRRGFSDIICPKQMTKHLPRIWKKMCHNQTVDTTILKKVFQLTELVSLSIPFEEVIRLEEIQNYIADNFDLGTPPRPVGFIRCSWSIVKRNKSCRLTELLSTHAADKETYASRPEKQKSAKIFKYLSDMITEYLDSDPMYSKKYMRKLTECVVVIARSSSSDEELYVLEDLVSPVMWLLARTDDSIVVKNVKTFLSILH